MVITALALAGWVMAASAPGPGGDAPSPPLPDTLPLSGRAVIERLTFPPLVFEPPVALEYEVGGVRVYHLHDPALPLVDLFVQLRGGVGHFPRREMAPITALPSLVRTGGTRELAPDSVDLRLDLLAAQLSVGSGGGGSFATLNALTTTFDESLALFREILLEPGFDREAVEVWRGQELERVRRREDDPGGLAYSEFNRLLFGDHPVGWVTTESDLAPELFTDERLRELHSRLFCRERIQIGVSGDLTWAEVEPRIRSFLAEWPSCSAPLPDPVHPQLREGPGVYILDKEVEQTTIILAQPGGLRQEDSEEYFASRIANHLLGASGFSSRLMTRIRSERGLAYGASSIWTTPARWEGLVGAVTSTRSDRTVETLSLILEILNDFRAAPPPEAEVERALEEIAMGWVFAFESAAQIVARRMSYRAQELPDNWLERYLEGIGEVTPGAVHSVVRERLRPAEMTILLVGDARQFGPGLEAFGPVYRMHPDGRIEPWERDPHPLRR